MLPVLKIKDRLHCWDASTASFEVLTFKAIKVDCAMWGKKSKASVSSIIHSSWSMLHACQQLQWFGTFSNILKCRQKSVSMSQLLFNCKSGDSDTGAARACRELCMGSQCWNLCPMCWIMSQVKNVLGTERTQWCLT